METEKELSKQLSTWWEAQSFAQGLRFYPQVLKLHPHCFPDCFDFTVSFSRTCAKMAISYRKFPFFQTSERMTIKNPKNLLPPCNSMEIPINTSSIFSFLFSICSGEIILPTLGHHIFPRLGVVSAPFKRSMASLRKERFLHHFCEL